MSENTNQRNLISIILENKKGMLSKITTLFADHDMNIETLTLSPVDTKNKIQRTVTCVSGDRDKIDKLCEELKKIDGVQKVINFMSTQFIEREVGLIKIKTSNPALTKITKLIREHNGEIIFANSKIMICEIEETEGKIDEFMSKARAITKEVEILRTGIVATSLEDDIN